MTRPKRLLLQTLVLIALCVIFVGPWPVDNNHFADSSYGRSTLEKVVQHDYAQHAGPLRGGYARADITPAVGVPLGGYSARDPKENEGALTPVYAQAITLDNGQRRVTLLGAEILLPLPELVNEVSRLSDIPREELFFTTSHSHSGPGGYANGFVAQASLGNFHAGYFAQLSQALAQIAKQSRDALQPVTLSYQRLEMDSKTGDSFIYNQLTQGPAGHHRLHWLAVRNQQNQPLANLISFSAHPTFLGRVNKKISGDYPGLLQQQLAKLLHSPVLFAVGAVGGMLPMGQGSTPAGDLPTQLAQMEEMSSRLSQWFMQQPRQPQWQASQAILDVALLPVTLPSPQFRLNDQWRLSPILVGAIFHDRQSYVHALRIGPLFLFAQPGDYSGELAQRLEDWGSERGLYPWITGFNGDYIGYIMPADRYDQQHYTVRDVNFFGRWAGDYLNEINKKFMQRATAD